MQIVVAFPMDEEQATAYGPIRVFEDSLRRLGRGGPVRGFRKICDQIRRRRSQAVEWQELAAACKQSFWYATKTGVLSPSDTAYPLLKSNPTERELQELFTPNLFELGFVEDRGKCLRIKSNAFRG